MISFLLTNMLGAQAGSKVEMLCVPLQQLAFVYNNNNDSLTEEEKTKIENMMNNKEDLLKYDGRNADNIKGNVNGEIISKNIGTYFKVWIKVGFKNIGGYVEFFIQYISILVS